MELCPKCRHMTAERNHYTGELICYNRFCFWDERKRLVKVEDNLEDYGPEIAGDE